MFTSSDEVLSFIAGEEKRPVHRRQILRTAGNEAHYGPVEVFPDRRYSRRTDVDGRRPRVFSRAKNPEHVAATHEQTSAVLTVSGRTNDPQLTFSVHDPLTGEQYAATRQHSRAARPRTTEGHRDARHGFLRHGGGVLILDPSGFEDGAETRLTYYVRIGRGRLEHGRDEERRATWPT